MGKTVRNYHRKDGSVRQTVSYSHKNIFGTRVVNTYSRDIAPKKRLRLTAHGWVLVLLIIVGLSVVSWFLFNIIAAESIGERICWIAALAVVIAVAGFVIYRSSQEPAQEAEKPPVISGNNWYCPKCDYKNNLSDHYCRSCNYEFPEMPQDLSDVELEGWVCDECGGRNPSGSRYCRNCNAPKP